MRSVVILALAVVLSAGLGMSYLMYRQLDTKTVMLAAEPRLEPNGEGALCGDVDFVVEARTLGRWLLRGVEDGQTISGVVAVGGDEDADISLRVWTPHNRLVLNGSERQHRQQFEVPAGIRGDYLFEFDNRHSALMSKQVTVSFCLA